MSNNENWIFGSALLGLSLVLGAAAAAMEPDKNGSFMQSSAPPSLPAFFDGTRLPSLQDMWNLGVGEPAAVSQPENAALSQDRIINEPKTPTVANVAGQPPENADRSTTTVRQRAEELSRRFGGGAKAPTPAPPQNEISKITTSALQAESVPGQEQGEQVATVTLEPENESKRAVSVGVIKAPSSPKAKRAAIPPIPLRAPRTAQVRKLLLPPKSHVGAAPLSNPPAAPAEKPASPQHTIPTQLQSLGWDTQVQSHP
jgi:hypothetical protein